jgi:prepilin peptidase CpaA
MLMFLGVGVATDLHQRRIPNWLIAMMFVLGISLNTIYLGGIGTRMALGGILTGTLILIPFFALGGMGAGDVKFLAGVGSFLGPWGVAVAGMYTLLLGGVLGLAVIAWQRVGPVFTSRFSSIPPSVSAAKSEVTIPYSVAIAAGTIAALY